MKKLTSIFKQPKNWTTLIVVIAVLAVLGLITTLSLRKNNETNTVKPGKTLSVEEASNKAEEFINTFLMQSGSTATVKEITSEYGLYKLSIDITSDVVESYLTKDGRLFFPQALNIDEITSENLGANQEAAAAPVVTVSKKNDKPVVELFVMSHCPFGTQMEKGMLPVVEALGDKIDFEIKFNNYAMHGEKELVEQINQYCIQKEQTDKFTEYLACFLDASDSATCLASANINTGDLAECYAKTDKEFKIMDNFRGQIGYQGSYPGFDIYDADNEKYGVGGSPTLVINGETISSNRDSASLLATICSAFNETPEECSTVLSNAAPSAGFGYGVADSASAASCE